MIQAFIQWPESYIEMHVHKPRGYALKTCSHTGYMANKAKNTPQEGGDSFLIANSCTVLFFSSQIFF